MFVPPSVVVSCCDDHFANWRRLHQGSLCPRTLHDGCSSLLCLIISYVHHLLTTLQCYRSRPFPPGLTYPYHFNPIPFHLLSYLLCPCCVRRGPHILATNGRLSLGGYYEALSDFRLPTGFDSRSSLQPQQQHPSSVLSRHQSLRFL